MCHVCMYIYIYIGFSFDLDDVQPLQKRRDMINEKMRALQKLVPNSKKVYIYNFIFFMFILNLATFLYFFIYDDSKN